MVPIWPIWPIWPVWPVWPVWKRKSFLDAKRLLFDHAAEDFGQRSQVFAVWIALCTVRSDKNDLVPLEGQPRRTLSSPGRSVAKAVFGGFSACVFAQKNGQLVHGALLALFGLHGGWVRAGKLGHVAARVFEGFDVSVEAFFPAADTKKNAQHQGVWSKGMSIHGLGHFTTIWQGGTMSYSDRKHPHACCRNADRCLRC